LNKLQLDFGTWNDYVIWNKFEVEVKIMGYSYTINNLNKRIQKRNNIGIKQSAKSFQDTTARKRNGINEDMGTS
jgi:hypothetical protein